MGNAEDGSMEGAGPPCEQFKSNSNYLEMGLTIGVDKSATLLNETTRSKKRTSR